MAVNILIGSYHAYFCAVFNKTILCYVCFILFDDKIQFFIDIQGLFLKFENFVISPIFFDSNT